MLARDDRGTLGADEAHIVAVRDSVQANGRVYVLVTKMLTVTVSAAQPEVVAHCLACREQSAATQTVNISYLSTTGAALMHDKADVQS